MAVYFLAYKLILISAKQKISNGLLNRTLRTPHSALYQDLCVMLDTDVSLLVVREDGVNLNYLFLCHNSCGLLIRCNLELVTVYDSYCVLGWFLQD